MSKIKNGRLDQYGAELFKQQQFRASGVEGVNVIVFTKCYNVTGVKLTIEGWRNLGFLPASFVLGGTRCPIRCSYSVLAIAVIACLTGESSSCISGGRVPVIIPSSASY